MKQEENKKEDYGNLKAKMQSSATLPKIVKLKDESKEEDRK
jgi:hypothetical protein